MDRFDDDTLFAELRELRPTPRPEFAAELDERAAAAFPRPADTTASVLAPLVDWWTGMSPRRRLMPVFAAAAAVIVLATAAVAISQSGRGSNPAEDAVLGAVAGGTRAAPEVATESGSGEAGGTAQTPNPTPHRSSGNHGGGSRSAGDEAAEQVYEVEVPSMENAPAAGVGATGGGEEPFSVPSEKAPAGAGRDIERSSYIVLGTKPGEVAGAAAKVYEAVHAADGFVLHSSVQSGKAGATGASFDLLIPSAKVDDALSAISAIAEVRERHDRTDDITAPTVGAAEELADSNASIEGLLKELAGVETEAERESVEARLHEERRRHAAIRASLDNLHQRAAMSEVSVRIVTGHGAGVAPAGSDSESGGWGVGDALHDAGHILTIAAGVVLIGLAVLLPIALIAFVLWAGNRLRLRRLRERTLG